MSGHGQHLSYVSFEASIQAVVRLVTLSRSSFIS